MRLGLALYNGTVEHHTKCISSVLLLPGVALLVQVLEWIGVELTTPIDLRY